MSRGYILNCLVLAFVVLLFFPFSLPAQQSLILTTPGEPPYCYPDRTGILDLWMKEAFSKIGLEVTLQSQPPERSLLNADMGLVDGDAVRIAGINKQYPNLIQVPEKVMISDFVGFTKNFTFSPIGWKSLQPYNVGIVRGHKISEANVTNARSVVKAPNTEILFSLLNNDRVDVVVCERLFGTMMAKKINPEIKAMEPPLATLDFYLYLHKKHQKLVPKVAQALKDMKNDGTYGRILRQGLERSYDRQ